MCKIICDKCSNYEVSASGTTETCHASKNGSRLIIDIDKIYIEKRMIGEKTNCKRFNKI